MAEGCLLMSAYERERSHLIRETVEKKLRQREAEERLGVSVSLFAVSRAARSGITRGPIKAVVGFPPTLASR